MKAKEKANQSKPRTQAVVGGGGGNDGGAHGASLVPVPKEVSLLILF